MRPNNQIKRSRGRNGGGRKHTNPMSRNYESNGPNVKIRGNAAHIAEKYLQLARDAQTVGDSVTAENMLQHAEHYFRIISAAQAQNPQRSEQPSMSNDDQSGGEGGTGDTPDERRAKPENNGERNRAVSSVDNRNERDNNSNAENGEAKRERPQRERRPRRKPRVEAAEGTDVPASAPTRDADALPAFLTGGQTDAAE